MAPRFLFEFPPVPILLTASPCIGQCKLDDDKRRCLGCGRLRPEIKAWKTLDEEARHDINVRLLVTEGKKVRKKILREVGRQLGESGAKKAG